MSVIQGTADTAYWDGEYSRFHRGKDIESYISHSIRQYKIPISCIIPRSDGFIGVNEYNRLCSEFGRRTPVLTCESRYCDIEYLRTSGSYPIVGGLCSRQLDRTNFILLPLDDMTFHMGLTSVLASIPNPTWEEKKSCVFWRGGSSGFDRPSLRTRVTTELFGYPNTDVRITPWGNWSNEQDIPPEFFAPREGLDRHFAHKYILIVDGNCIASNHQWVFGSGSVPIMITHPDNRYWFQKYLKPMVNYVPISYDLSDLKEKIDWLLSHDEEAKTIASNALELSKTIFSPEFQRQYIDNAIAGVIYNSHSHLVQNYNTLRETPSDINEHLPTLFDYAKKCDSIVECGVREIVSSYAFASALLENPKNSLTLVDLYESSKMRPFLEVCASENINAKFIIGSDTECDAIRTDLLFIDTWHVYAHLKRELAHWCDHVSKYIILHDTTVDEIYGESIRGGMDIRKQSIESGYPEEEIRRGLWPAVTEFLAIHPEWTIEKRYTNNNGLTILARV